MKPTNQEIAVRALLLGEFDEDRLLVLLELWDELRYAGRVRG